MWLYDGETGRRRRLTTDGVSRHDSRPRFRSGGMVTYLTSNQESDPDRAVSMLDAFYDPWLARAAA